MVEIDVAVLHVRRAPDRCGSSTAPASDCSAQTAEQLLGRTRRTISACADLSRWPDRLASRTSRSRAAPADARCAAPRSARSGRPHQLLVLADVSRPLRDEERQAWQRLIRVIGHEINNSLAPIKSIAGSLESMLRA